MLSATNSFRSKFVIEKHGKNKVNGSNIIIVLVFSISFVALNACTSKRTCEDIRADNYKEINVPGLKLNEILELSLKYRTEYKESGCPGKL